MDMRGVVPVAGERGGRPVEDDLAPYEDEPLHELLDGPELVRDVKDRGAELRVKVLEQSGEGLLGVRIHARRRFVEHEEIGLARQRFCDVSALPLSAGKPVDRVIGPLNEADALDCAANGSAIRARIRAEEAASRNAASENELPHGHGRFDTDEGALREVPESGAVVEVVRWVAEEERFAGRGPDEAEREADKSGLATSVRPGDADELACGELEIDPVEHRRATGVGVRNVVQRDG
jgi:hypothetical protein